MREASASICNKIGHSTTDPTDTKSLLRKYYEQFKANEFENLDETFLKNINYYQEVTDLAPVLIKEAEYVIKNYPTKER